MKKKLVLFMLLASMCTGCGNSKSEVLPSEIYQTVFSDAKAVETEASEWEIDIEGWQKKQEETAVKEFKENKDTLSIEQVLYATAPSKREFEEELYCDSLEMLAICVMAESGNQDLEGMRMVADVILNRVDDPYWPDTIEGVISQSGQFSCYWDGGMEKWNVPSEDVYKACQMELSHRSYPYLYYFKEGIYSKYGTPRFKHGAHYFSGK